MEKLYKEIANKTIESVRSGELVNKKKERLDLMIDIETLGKNNNALIFQIAAVGFSLETGDIYEDVCFNQIVDIDEIANIVVPAEVGTLSFWIDNADLFKSLTEEAKGSKLNREDLLINFHEFLSDYAEIYDLYFWANGPTFDTFKIKTQFENLNLDWPIKYNNDRDLRTYMDMASTLIGVDQGTFTHYLTPLINEEHHNAYYDCVAQIKKVFICNEITKKIYQD